MNSNFNLNTILRNRPQAIANIKGSENYPYIKGVARFYNTKNGVLIATEVNGLPTANDNCKQPIFAYHLHQGNSCSGDSQDPFMNARTHYNPNRCDHPYHAGDMPPLFGANGKSISVFLSDRFSINEIIGKTVIIHSGIDDFTTQPSGNSGTKIACGEIKRI